MAKKKQEQQEQSQDDPFPKRRLGTERLTAFRQ